VLIPLLARWRVPLGFASAATAFVLARPTWASWRAGAALALTGELLRVWAAGHLEKGREVTRSGPYRYVRHPLYLGSALLGAGFAVASGRVIVGVIAAVYLGITLLAAIRFEETLLDARFQGLYSDYRAGRVTPMTRRFSWARFRSNHEYRAVLGAMLVFAVLAWFARRGGGQVLR
jgi:protein-S-isoprenylcysteine O-methyltransferase Ste14